MLKLENGKYYIDEPAVIKKVSTAKSSPTHTHSFIELTYILKGKCVHIVDGITYPAAHGDMVIINFGQSHSLICGDETVYINILIKPELFNESIKDSENAFSLLALEDFEDFKNSVNPQNCFISFEKGERVKIESIIDCLLSENEKDPGSTLMMRSGFNMLFIYLFRKMSLAMQSGFKSVDKKLLQYLKDNCSENLSAESVAGMCGYNASYFSRLFKACSKKTFTEYITECRIEKACKLLDSSDLSVEQIISESGFANRTNFFKIFKSATGMTPLYYRKSKK